MGPASATAAAASVERLAPPDRGFFGKRLVSQAGVPVLSHACVADAALEEAARRITRQLSRAQALRRNMVELGCEVQVIGKDQGCSALPEYRHLGPDEAKALDDRGRGYGGFNASCGEENLLRLPCDRYRDHRDILTHEFAHTCLSWGLGAAFEEAVDAQRLRSLAKGLWETTYASTNAQEFFAELTMYFGSRGDYGRLEPPPREGADWLRGYDPEAFALIDRIYSGEWSPEPLSLRPLRGFPADAVTTPTRSPTDEGAPSRVLVDNRTDCPLLLEWLDFEGEPREYATVAPQSVQGQDTFARHVWVARSAPPGDASSATPTAADGGLPSASGRGELGDDAPAGAVSQRAEVLIVFLAGEGIGRLVIGEGGDDGRRRAAAGSKKRRVGAAGGVLSMLAACGCVGVERGAEELGGRREAGRLGAGDWGASDWDWAGDVRVSAKTVATDFPWTFM